MFFAGGGTASDTPTVAALEVGARSGVQFTDQIIHHRSPNRRAMWAFLRLARG